MARQIVLLRGINIGSKRRVAMPKLREALEDAGYKDVQTYVQSGNVVLSTSKSAKQTARAVEKLIKQHFRIDVPVVARTKGELASVVKGNPLESVAKDPKRYQVRPQSVCGHQPVNQSIRSVDGHANWRRDE